MVLPNEGSISMADSIETITLSSAIAKGSQHYTLGDAVRLIDQYGNYLERRVDSQSGDVYMVSNAVYNRAGEPLCVPLETAVQSLFASINNPDENIIARMYHAGMNGARFAYNGTRIYNVPANSIPNLCKPARER